MNKRSFIAIDFETATGKRSSICEVGICVVRDGEVLETKSWLVQPENNTYAYWNTQVHGIRPEDTSSAPFFPEVWREIERDYLGEYNTFVAHNAPSTAVVWSKQPSCMGLPWEHCSGIAR